MEHRTSATNGPVRAMTYAAHSSGIIYIRQESRLIVVVPNVLGNYVLNGNATALLANGFRVYHVSIIPRNLFSYWIPVGTLTNRLAPVAHLSSFSVPSLPFSWNWTSPVINHPLRFARGNLGPRWMPLPPSNFHRGMLAIQGRVENVDTGLSRETILARMRCFKYQLTEGSTSDKDTCSICLDDFSDGQNIGSTNCQHSFHFDCISQWLMQKNSCPLCKRIALAI